MRAFGLFVVMAAVAVFAIVPIGCNNSSSTPEPSNSPSNGADDHDGHDHGSNDGKAAMEKMAEGLANLSEADRASAEKQHTCPVTGDMLGTMGEPIKVTVNGQDVWICCDGCEEPLLEDPEMYLAKLKK